MPFIKKPPETVTRSVRLVQPVSVLLDEYCRFVERTADYVTNFALRKTLCRDPEYQRCKAAQTGSPSLQETIPSLPTARKT
jgi:hypothetical protein